MNDLISPEYRVENERLHVRPGYGSSGHYWLGHILELCDMINAKTVLDYGAGKATLGPMLQRFGLKYTPYDPATYPKRPEGLFDLVIALDVLEHIEPDKRQAVLQDIERHTGKAFFCVVSTRPSSKNLSDGRNAHLIVENWYGWKPHILGPGLFRTARIRQQSETFDFVGYPRAPRGLNGVERAMIKGGKKA